MHSIETKLAEGFEHHQAGRLEQAEALYRAALDAEPNHPHALHMLGILAHQQQRNDLALELIRKAIAADASVPEFHNNLAVVLAAMNRDDEAITASREAIRLKPNFFQAQLQLGKLLLSKQGYAEAVDPLTRAAAIDPGSVEAHFYLANALKLQNQFSAAIVEYRRAISIRPDYAEAYANLSDALREVGDLSAAVDAGRRAVELAPHLAAAHNNLGVTFADLGRLDEAETAYRRAIALEPSADAYSNLANTQRNQAAFDEAIESYRKALELNPIPEIHTNLIHTMHSQADERFDALFTEYAAWARRYAEPLTLAARAHENDRNPQRRLRIGYVSPDLAEGAVGQFLVPIFSSHDHEKFEIACYASVIKPDPMTDRLRGFVDAWHDVRGLNDAQLAELIGVHRVDILVDLSLHTARNRLLTFARKPAPVQVTYLGYAGTTGTRAINYRFTDPFMDPPDSPLPPYSEESVWLKTYWCYPRREDVPEPSELPALANDHVTFGCLNQFGKITPQAIEAWAMILSKVSNSRLILSASEGRHRDRALEQFATHGVDTHRVEFLAKMSVQDYFRTYQRIDIALDSFPYNGGTTTCDALWMGIPVVAVAGKMAISRAGVSLLNNAHLPELVGQNFNDYIRIALETANDLSRLSRLRKTMRDRLRASPLTDAVAFTRKLENAYRKMWQRWCDHPKLSS